MNLRDLPEEESSVLHGPPLPPKTAARRLCDASIKGEYEAEALHAYTDSEGNIIHWRIRARLPDGDKWIRPMSVRGMVYELQEPPFSDGLKPLYRLHELMAGRKSGRPIFFVEGEKAADALSKIGVLATTAGGATSDERADCRTLAGEHVIAWADNDKPGRAHMQRVAAKARAAGATVEILDIDALSLPRHGDAYDYLLCHPSTTEADLMALPRHSDEPRLIARTSGNAIVELRCGDTIKIEPIRWIWDGWLARGKLHILAGAPGTGKTTLALAFAAAVTTGAPFPDGSRCDCGDVLIWSGEDDPSDTLAPRLSAMGADLSRVHFVGAVAVKGGRRVFDPATDVAALSNALSAIPKLQLVIIDPIVNAVLGDGHKNGDVRRGLAPLVDLASQLNCALLGISHFPRAPPEKTPLIESRAVSPSAH